MFPAFPDSCSLVMCIRSFYLKRILGAQVFHVPLTFLNPCSIVGFTPIAGYEVCGGTRSIVESGVRPKAVK
jgi:hypothetical protein